MTDRIRAVVAVAGVMRRDYLVFTEESLRQAARDNGPPYTYDEATKSLIYDGPFPAMPPRVPEEK